MRLLILILTLGMLITGVVLINDAARPSQSERRQTCIGNEVWLRNYGTAAQWQNIITGCDDEYPGN